VTGRSFSPRPSSGVTSTTSSELSNQRSILRSQSEESGVSREQPNGENRYFAFAVAFLVVIPQGSASVGAVALAVAVASLFPTAEAVISTEAAHGFTVSSTAEKSAS
jgi:hypothetical protein